ncbi:hypothetical protein GCM10022381_02140 [Leifsonia kafniensis]|uniref:Glycosyltransferase 2-like domain-containing protein n=1 Tax=Leifsonia kafniensis TaxID=475957 RepID=A0ABP7K0J4_9MICO
MRADVTRLDAEYVLPIRWEQDAAREQLTTYLSWLSTYLDITVVDGSPQPLFDAHARDWAPFARHLGVEPWPGRNGKVAGVMTGVRHARHELLVIADDDVRYDEASLRRLVGLLGAADVVRPQNYFCLLPWHARWDTARTLINRAIAVDYPGTLGVRRSALLATGGYDGDVLFENRELICTVRASGGRERRANDLFVARVPPTWRHFMSQRVRQAYDDFAQPARLGTELMMLPLLVWALRRWKTTVGIVAAACILAETGRRRENGRSVFPATSLLWAPVWVVERAVCIWIALGMRATGGVRYAGGRVKRAGSSMSSIRRRQADRTMKRQG